MKTSEKKIQLEMKHFRLKKFLEKKIEFPPNFLQLRIPFFPKKNHFCHFHSRPAWLISMTNQINAKTNNNRHKTKNNKNIKGVRRK